MAQLRRPLTLLLVAAYSCVTFFSPSDATALVPPTGGENPTGDGDIEIIDPSGAGGGAFGSGGNPGVAEPPLGIYLNRSTYYVGEVITGQLDCPTCSPTDPIFVDTAGNVITGTMVHSETYYGAFTFIPDAPLAVGNYSVSVEYATTVFEVIPGQAPLPTYQATLIESSSPVGDPLECQSVVPGYSASAYAQSRIDAALSLTMMGASTDQYVFEFSIDGAERTSTTVGYPFATFRQGDGEFCVEVFALPLNGAAELSLGAVCMDPDVELMLGVRDVPFGSIENVLAFCELPPDGYMEEWCAQHAEAFTRHSCTGFVVEACVQARYECEDGDLPEWYDENGLDPNDPNAPYGLGGSGSGGNGSGGSGTGGNGTGASGSGASGTGANSGSGAEGNSDEFDDGKASGEAGGCSCRTGVSSSGTAGNKVFLLATLFGALVALRRRERKFPA